MSTKIGVISEGSIDHILLKALLPRIAYDKAGFRWPVNIDDVAEHFPIRKRGHGGVLDTVRKLVKSLDSQHFEHAFFVVVLDKRTKPVQAELQKIIQNDTRFILAIAIEEIEAWWLGDRTNTLRWSNLDILPDCRYSNEKYKAERDDAPKKTLNELTLHSSRFDSCYGVGNVDTASEFAEEYWKSHAKLDEIASQCPEGFKKFLDHITNCFRQEKSSKRAQKH